MADELELTAVLRSPPSQDGAEIAALPSEVTCLELRADQVGDLSVAWLRQRFPGRLRYSLRSGSAPGGLDPSARAARLRQAARTFDEIELELEWDLPLLDELSGGRCLLASYQAHANPQALRARAAALREYAARRHRLVFEASVAGDELSALTLGLATPGVDVVAEGPGAFWTRIARAFAGAREVSADVANNGGEPTIAQVISDYGLPRRRRIKRVFGIAGSPVYQSLSPRLHNTTSAALDLPCLYLPFAVTDFARFWDTVVPSSAFGALGWRLEGLTTASPHKEAARAVADMCGDRAEAADAVNVLLRERNGWYGDTTDAHAVVQLMHDRSVGLRGRRAAVIGCGGTGRAVAHALHSYGAAVTLVNRGEARARRAAELLGLPQAQLQGFAPDGYDLLVNATPLGTSADDLPCDPRRLAPGAVVIDYPYQDHPTALVQAAQAAGHTVIPGPEVLVTQACRQFELMTGATMPRARARAMLGLPVESPRTLARPPIIWARTAYEGRGG